MTEDLTALAWISALFVALCAIAVTMRSIRFRKWFWQTRVGTRLHSWHIMWMSM